MRGAEEQEEDAKATIGNHQDAGGAAAAGREHRQNDGYQQLREIPVNGMPGTKPRTREHDDSDVDRHQDSRTAKAPGHRFGSYLPENPGWLDHHATHLPVDLPREPAADMNTVELPPHISLLVERSVQE